MATLYSLTDEYLALLEMAEDETDPQVIEDTLEGLKGEIEDKADAYAAIIAQLNGEADILSTEIRRLQNRKMAMVNNANRIKDHLYKCMKILDMRKIKTVKHTFTIQQNGGKLPVFLNDGVKIEDLPDSLLVKSVNMEKLRKTLEDGNTIWGHYGTRGESLRIR